MKILVTIPKGYIRNTFFTKENIIKIEELGNVIYNEFDRNFSEDELCEIIKDVDVCITGWGSPFFTKKVLKCANNLKVIAHSGGTVAQLVNDEVYNNNIRVISGNEIFALSVAEGTVCYILSALRRIPQFTNKMQKDGWVNGNWYNEGLIGKKVGLVGFGAVAKHTSKLLSAFQTETYTCFDFMSDEELNKYPVKRANLEDIFKHCDIVSIHLAKTIQTHHIIDEHLLSYLKPNSLLVNTSRGEIIDEQAMTQMLKEKRFRAILDVYEKEPLPMTSELRNLENVILIPHMAGPTIDRRKFVISEMIKEIPKILNGESSYLEISREYMQRMTR